MTVRVLVVDDQEPFRLAAAAVVAATDGFQVVGSAASGEASLIAVDELRPDLVLMDIHLPGIDGVESTRQIRQRQPSVRVLLLSTHEHYDDAAKCGAVGYLPKRTLDPTRLQGVWAAQARATPSDPPHARSLAEGARAHADSRELTQTSHGSSAVSARDG